MLKIGVASGKGGVGKTTVAIALGKKLAEDHHTALVDLDISMLNVRDALDGEINVKKDKLIPARDGNLEYVYYDASKKSQIQWDYGDYGEAAKQLISRTEWNNPNYMLLDLPPGIDEISTTILPMCDGVILVMQPHPFSISNANRVIEFCRDEGVPMCGIVLNFSGFTCPSCGAIFNFEPERNFLNWFEVKVISKIPFIPNAKINDIMRYIDVEKVVEAIENPITLKKRRKVLSKMLKRFLVSGKNV
jgi:ATP-binding protein involved in chromosome partitioning